jgi:hypothetical protein
MPALLYYWKRAKSILLTSITAVHPPHYNTAQHHAKPFDKQVRIPQADTTETSSTMPHRATARLREAERG